jgi:putative tryptophan/tyrosine transport system substrate-binding protein
MTEEMNPKRLALLKEMAPSVHRVGVLLRQDFPSEGIAKRDWHKVESAAHQLELELVALNVRTADEITTAFDQASANGVQGIVTFRNPTVVTYLDQIAALSRKYRLPAVFDAREYVEAGGLMSYGPSIDKTYRQLATYTYKLLHGTPVNNLPIEQPTTFELVINKRTASDIGISIPASLLTRADKVIE